MMLTREEIENMSAGREMDVLISTCYFGYKVTKDCWNIHIEHIADIAHVMPHYSEWMNSANIITTSPKTKEFYLEHKNDEWFCMIGDNLNNGVVAKTAPLAICRAALLAVQSASPTHDLP